jgi:uncharacterized phiE125 gp8 family phage protein
MKIALITGPTTEPVTVTEVKLHTRISHSVEDTLLASWIKSARLLAEGYQRRAYITQTLELIYDEFPDMPINVPRAPLISVTSIKYTDYLNVETTYAAANYIVDATGDPGRIDLAYGIVWPTTMLRSINAVRVRFTAGYGVDATTTPDNVKDAIMLYCAYRNENRAAEEDAPEAFFNLLRHDRMIIGGCDD